MRFHLAAAITLVVCLPSVVAQGAGSKLPVHLVQYATSPIKEDGKLDEPAWSTAEWSREFRWIDAGDAAPVFSRMKVLYDREALHFAFEYDSPLQSPIPLDPELPRACEVFLDPEGRGSRYLEFAVSPEGAQHCLVWAGKLSVREWSSTNGPPARVGISRRPAGKGQQRTVYEISFSWKSLADKSLGAVLGRAAPPARGDAWRANFSRVEQDGDFVWSPAGYYYMHHPNTFGWLLFAGEQDPLTKVPDNLVAQPDDATLNKIGPQFKKIRSTNWVQFPVTTAANGDLYIVTKTGIERIDAAGKLRFSVTRKEGLPQFIRSFLPVGDVAYVAGNGLKPGLVRVESTGGVSTPGVEENYALSGVPALLPLHDGSLLVASSNVYQRLEQGKFLDPVQTAGTINKAVLLEKGRIVLATSTGFELREPNRPATRIDIAGGISQCIPFRGAALGISAREGVFRVQADGSGGFYPSPLRIKFTALHEDGRGHVWAGFIGGLLAIENERLEYFHEPLGLSGVQILNAATGSSGETVFLATIPNSTWYRSNQYSAFLIVRDGKTWKKLTYADGLPGHVSAITSLNGRILISSTMGVFEYLPVGKLE